MLLDPLTDALSTIENCEAIGKDIAYVSPVNNLIKETLKILNDKEYIKEARYIENDRGGIYKVRLGGKIHNLQAIKPRFPVGNDEIEKWEKQFLPSHALGSLVLTTPEGIMTHEQAKEKGIGGKLIAYVY